MMIFRVINIFQKQKINILTITKPVSLAWFNKTRIAIYFKHVQWRNSSIDKLVLECYRLTNFWSNAFLIKTFERFWFSNSYVQYCHNNHKFRSFYRVHFKFYWNRISMCKDYSGECWTAA
jgi:hypothetical protein